MYRQCALFYGNVGRWCSRHQNAEFFRLYAQIFRLYSGCFISYRTFNFLLAIQETAVAERVKMMKCNVFNSIN